MLPAGPAVECGCIFSACGTIITDFILNEEMVGTSRHFVDDEFHLHVCEIFSEDRFTGCAPAIGPEHGFRLIQLDFIHINITWLIYFWRVWNDIRESLQIAHT